MRFSFTPALPIPANGVAMGHVSVDLSAGAAPGSNLGTALTSSQAISNTSNLPVVYPHGAAVGPLIGVFSVSDMLPLVDSFEETPANRRATVTAGPYPTATSTGTTVATSTSTADASVAIVTSVNSVLPHLGRNMAALYAVQGPATGAIDYYFDLSSYDLSSDDIYVEFFHENVGATDDPEDHVFLSLDGGLTWTASIYDFDLAVPGPSTWAHAQIDLSAFMRDVGLLLSSQVVLRLQAASDTDALLIDDVFVGIPQALRVERGPAGRIPNGGLDVLGPVLGESWTRVTYDIFNDGQRDLHVGSSTTVFSNIVNLAIVSSSDDLIVPPSTSGTIAYDLYVPDPGPFSVDLSFPADDPRLLGTYAVSLLGTGRFYPEIGLYAGDRPVSSGDHLDLGAIQLGDLARLDFVLENTGRVDLTLTSSPGIALLDEVNLAAAVATSPASPIGAGGEAPFTVTLTPARGGPYSAQLSVANDDPDESPYLVRLSGLALEADLAVTRGADVVSSGTVEDLGRLAVGASQTFGYALGNSGNQTLVFSDLPPATLWGVPDTLDVQVAQMPAPSLEPGGSTQLELTVTVVGEGDFTFDLALASNDADSPTYIVRYTGAGFVPRPEIVVRRDGIERVNGSTEYVGGSVPGLTQTLRYVIENDGEDDLTISASTVQGAQNVTASVSTPPAATVAPGSSSTMQVEYNPDAEGPMGFTIVITNDDPDEGTYTLAIAGLGDPSAPEIAVSQPASDGDTVDLGEVEVGATRNVTFTVENRGAGPLHLGGDPVVEFTRIENATTTLVSAPDATIEAGASSPFTVSVSPSASGAFTVAMQIANDDGDEGNYVVTVSGVGVPAGSDNGGCACSTPHRRWLGLARPGCGPAPVRPRPSTLSLPEAMRAS